MSQEPSDGPHVIHRAKGNAGWKLLAGAAAAAVVFAGGYYAWKNSGPAQPSSEIAYNEPSTADAVHVGALPQEQGATVTQENATEENATSAGSAPTRTAAVTRRRPTERAEAVPEEVVGVTPVSATTHDNDEIIVNAARGPVWTRRPNAYRLAGVYPERALERGREGEASVHCTVRNSGSLDCVPVSEMPAHSGFGDAALRVARMYRHAPQRADGSAADGTPVNLRVVFRMADDRHG